MFVPPVQAHADAVIWGDTLDNHTEIIDNDHQEEHHQNDSEENKNTKHHHHCTTQSTISSFITNEFQFHFYKSTTEKNVILFYKQMNSSSVIKIPEKPPCK
jgi:hypothetical protein